MIKQIKQMDVYSEEFLLIFHATLEKFATEYADMSAMTAIKQANDLLKTINS